MSHISMGNSITSLRLCATLDWNEYVEDVSLIEQILQRDPPGVYARMDFASRDRYRHAVEELADPTGEAQVRVALRADRERAPGGRDSRGPTPRAAHVGYHLIGPRPPRARAATWPTVRRLRAARAARAVRARHARLPRLDRAAHGARRGGARWRWRGPPTRRAGCWPGSAAVALAPGQRISPWRSCTASSTASPGRGCCRGSTCAAASRVGAHHGDRADPALVGRGRPRPGRAPRGPRARQHGPATSTSRCSPTSRTRPPSTCPARTRCSPAAIAGIEALNARYAPGTADRFFLFHRARRWNGSEGVWMGWERKRGKIEEFNRLLRGAGDTSFAVQVGDPRGPAARPLLHHARQRHAPAARRGAPADRRDRASAQPAALRPRARPGGRGLRHPPAAGQRDDGERRGLAVRARLRRAHRHRPLHHRGLRHLPGPVRRGQLHRQGALRRGRVQRRARRAASRRTRCSRTTCSRACSRAARWSRTSRSWTTSPRACSPTRGASTAGCAATGRSCSACCRWCRRRHGLERSRLPLISRWKILDNLRRSLVAPALLALLVSAWTWLPGSPLGWTLAALAVLGFPLLPPLVHLAGGPRPQQPLGRLPATTCGRSCRPRARRCCSQITLLAYHAYEMLHAIVLTLVRMVITQRRLLEWETAAATRGARRRGCSRAGARGCSSPRCGRARRPRWRCCWACCRLRGQRAAAWRCRSSPRGWPRRVVAWWLSRPVVPRRLVLGRGRRRAAAPASRAGPGTTSSGSSPRRITGCRPTTSRRRRNCAIAHRTSPTNIGMGLLSTLAAHDLGYLRHRRARRPHRGDARHASSRSSATRATCSTGTTRRASRRWRRATSRPWTAATWRASLMALAGRAARARRAARGPGRGRGCAAAPPTRAGVLAEALAALARRRSHAATPLPAPRRRRRSASWARCARRSRGDGPAARRVAKLAGTSRRRRPARRARGRCRGGALRRAPKPTRGRGVGPRCSHEALALPAGERRAGPTRCARGCIDLARRCDDLADAHGLEVPLRPRRAASSRSASGSPTPRARAASTPRTTTCWPPRPGSRASSPSPAARCRRSTGSGSRARW